MGCGGSKSSEIATGNTVIRTVLDKKSDASTRSLEQKSTDVHENPTQDPDSSEKPNVAVTDVKDIAENNEIKEGTKVNNEAPLGDANAGKLITRDSPEQYFSTRKDESVDVVAVTDVECFSPGTEPSEGVKKEEESVVGNDDSKKNEEPACSIADDKKNEEHLPENSEEQNLAEGKEKVNEMEPESIVAEETKVKSLTEQDKVTSVEDPNEEPKP